MAELDLGMNLYEFNKQGMNSYDPLDTIALGVKISELAKDLFAREKLKYWMLLGYENRDFTIFNFLDRDNAKGFKKDFTETLTNRGKVLNIEKQPDGNYEIWIREVDSDENLVYYFFDYTEGVIEI